MTFEDSSSSDNDMQPKQMPSHSSSDSDCREDNERQASASPRTREDQSPAGDKPYDNDVDMSEPRSAAYEEQTDAHENGESPARSSSRDHSRDKSSGRKSRSTSKTPDRHRNRSHSNSAKSDSPCEKADRSRSASRSKRSRTSRSLSPSRSKRSRASRSTSRSKRSRVTRSRSASRSKRSRSRSASRSRSRSHKRSSKSARRRSRTPRRRRRSTSRRRSRSTSRPRRRRSRSRTPPEGARIHVSDLDVDVRKRELEKLYEKYGKVREIWMARNPPCFAFVVFSRRRDAEDAIHDTNGMTLGHCRIKVSMARPRVRGGRFRATRDRSLRCYQCGEVGHFSRNCTDREFGYRRPPSPAGHRSHKVVRSRSRSRSWS